MNNSTHQLTNSMYCMCGQDAVTCQVCAHQVCGTQTVWTKVMSYNFNGSVCLPCSAKMESK